jgi:hypothetical protein
LRSTGRISPGWSTSDGGGPDVARRRLEEEGVRFGPGDVADPLLRWDPQAAVQGASVAAPAADG